MEKRGLRLVVDNTKSPEELCNERLDDLNTLIAIAIEEAHAALDKNDSLKAQRCIQSVLRDLPDALLAYVEVTRQLPKKSSDDDPEVA